MKLRLRGNRTLLLCFLCVMIALTLYTLLPALSARGGDSAPSRGPEPANNRTSDELKVAASGWV